MAAENSAIWQVQSAAANGTEATATATNTVLFNPSPIVGSGDSYIYQTEFTIRNSTPETEAVDEANNEIQDMGLDGIDIQVTGELTDVNNDVAANSINKLIKWMKEAKGGSVVTGFTKGRFGLRLDDTPQFNVNPTSTFGYVLSDVRFVRVGDKQDRVAFVATLRLSGDLLNAI